MPDRAGGGRRRFRGAPNACASDRAKRPRKAAPDAAAAPRRKSRRLIVMIPPVGRITPHSVKTPPQPRVAGGRAEGRIHHAWEQRRAEANERTTEQERRVKSDPAQARPTRRTVP